MNIFFYYTRSVKGMVTKKTNYKHDIFKVNLLIMSRKVCVTNENELKNATKFNTGFIKITLNLKIYLSQLTPSLRFIKESEKLS